MMAILPWRRKRERAEQAKLDELNRLMSDRGTVSFVERLPYPAPVHCPWSSPHLGASEVTGKVIADQLRLAVSGTMPKAVNLLERCGHDAQIVKWGDRYVFIYTLINSTGQTLYYYSGDPMHPSWPRKRDAGYERNIHSVWDLVLDIWPLYSHFHDGFLSCARPSTGIYQVKDINEFSTGQFTSLGIDDEGLRERAKGCYPFYRSPTGDIVTLDITGQCPGRADLWRPRADPELDIDFWDTIDTLLTTAIDPHHNTLDDQ